jgi:regulator of protease activity HflC (stomatin/prohibitin superfamily)
LNSSGIVLETLNFGEVRPPEEVEGAINNKIKALQAAEEAKARLEQAKVDAETVRTKAQGDADAKLIEAEAEAKANKLRSESLTHNGAMVVELEAIKKWDGSYPQFIGGSGSIPLIQLPINKESKQ